MTIAQGRPTVLKLDGSVCTCGDCTSSAALCDVCKEEMDMWIEEQMKMHEEDLINMAEMEAQNG